MTSLESINRLRAIAARLLEREDPDGAWFTASLQQFETGVRSGMTLEQAFGLACAPGERPWWQLETVRRRDELLRDIRARHFPNLEGRPAAARIARELAHYEGGRWRRDRGYLAPPEGLRGDLFRLLKLGAPLSAPTIRRALVGSRNTPVREPRPA